MQEKILGMRVKNAAMILFVGEDGKVISALNGRGRPLPDPDPNQSEASAIEGTYIMTVADLSTDPDPGTCCWRVVGGVPICKKAYCV